MNLAVQIIFLLILTTSCGEAQDQSKKFLDEKGKFVISFPHEPVKSIVKGNRKHGESHVTSFVVKPKNDSNLSYEVYYVDFPTNYIDTLSIEQLYDLFSDSQPKRVDTTAIRMIGAFNHKLNGYTGKEFRWQHLESKVFTRTRFFMVQNRMYILVVETEGSNNFNVGINYFFNSFDIINTEPLIQNEEVSIKIQKPYLVNFPKPTEIRELETPTPYGNAEIFMELYQPKLINDDNIGYSVTIVEYQTNILLSNDFDLNTYYSDVIQTAIRGRQSNLVSKKKIFKNGFEGIEFEENFKGGQIINKQRSFLIGKKLLVVSVMTVPDNYENKSMEMFFDSFKIENE